MKKLKLAAYTIAVLIAAQFTSCSASSYDKNSEYLTQNYNGYADMESGSSHGTNYYEEYAEDKAEDKYNTQVVSDSSSDTVSENDLSSRKIIKTANVSYQTQTYNEFMQSISDCINSYGGYIESSELYGNNMYSSHSARNASITARIPADSYDLFMTAVCDMGTLTYKSESSNDVTMNYVDTESRIRALESEYDVLLEILDKSTSLDDVIAIQSRISEINYQMDSYKSQLRKYDDLISYCTVHINVEEVEREIPIEETMSFSDKIKNGLTETFFKIEKDASALAVWFITSLPYIIIFAVVIILMAFVLKTIIYKTKKRKEKKHIDMLIKQIDENKKNDKQNN